MVAVISHTGWGNNLGIRAAPTLVGVALLATACSGTADEAPTTSGAPVPTTAVVSPTTTDPTTTSTTTTTEPPRQIFQDWELVDLSEVAPRPAHLAVAGDVLWLTGSADGKGYVAWSDDARTWTIVDLALSGATQKQINDLPVFAIGGSESGLVGVALNQPAEDGTSADGVFRDVWTVQSEGKDVELLLPADTGLDQRTGVDQNFRFDELYTVERRGSDFAVFGVGQWWRPFETYKADMAAAIRTDGAWTVFAPDEDAGRFSFGDSASFGDSMVVVGFLGAADRNMLVSYVTDDLVSWRRGAGMRQTDGQELSVTAVGAGAPGFVAAGLIGTTTTAWFSANGVDWEVAAHPAIGGRTPASITWVDGAFYMFHEDDNQVSASKSQDGLVWETFDMASPEWGYDGRSVVLWRDRILVLTDRQELAISPSLP